MKKRKLIIISGATASGKTSFSIKISNLIRDELSKVARIINFDSLLFYKELNIGTAKPTEEEKNGHPHSLIDICSIKSPVNAHDYIQMAEEEINKAHQADEIPLLVGGSAFYLRALLKGMYESTGASEELKKEIEEQMHKEGITPFIDFLKIHDPDSMEVLHENDHYRILRAYEHFKQTGEPFSRQKKLMDALDPYDLTNGKHPEWDLHHVYLEIPRQEHWSYIVRRTNQMIEDGLVQEVKQLLEAGHTGEEKPLKSIGYIETIDFLNGKFEDQKEYAERISISTRQLAKSQRTFFKKIRPKLTYHPLTDQENILAETLDFIRRK